MSRSILWLLIIGVVFSFSNPARAEEGSLFDMPPPRPLDLLEHARPFNSGISTAELLALREQDEDRCGQPAGATREQICAACAANREVWRAQFLQEVQDNLAALNDALQLELQTQLQPYEDQIAALEQLLAGPPLPGMSMEAYHASRRPIILEIEALEAMIQAIRASMDLRRAEETVGVWRDRYNWWHSFFAPYRRTMQVFNCEGARPEPTPDPEPTPEPTGTPEPSPTP